MNFPRQKLTKAGSHFHGPRRWMALRPGAGARRPLLLVGAIVGTQVLQWLVLFGPNVGPGSAVTVLAASKIPDDKLRTMEVSGVNFSRTTGKIQLQLQAEQPMTLSSDEDDADVRRVLTFVVANGDRFDAGIRLDCVEALRAAASDEQTRAALLAAARKDQNPAVRLKALDALRDLVGLPAVRDALLETLQRDPNPGVARRSGESVGAGRSNPRTKHQKLRQRRRRMISLRQALPVSLPAK